MSCFANVNHIPSKDEIIVYKNLDNTLLVYTPEMLFSKSHDISIKYMSENYYKAMIDTLNKYGVKQNTYPIPKTTYSFIAKNKKNNDTLYANATMKEWWIIKNKKKLYLKDENQKTFKFLSFYSYFF